MEERAARSLRLVPDDWDLLSCGFVVERVTRIELALSARESDRSPPMKPLNSKLGRPVVAVVDRLSPWLIAR